MENYILIGICLVIVLVMSIQLYRTYTWQKLLNKKQSEFINKTHVKVNTKEYYAPLGVAMCCMLIVFVAPPNKVAFDNANLEVANEANQSISVYSTDDSADELKMESAITTALGTMNKAIELAETTRLDSVLFEGLDIADVSLEKVNPLANTLCSETIVKVLNSGEVVLTSETINESDYLITISTGNTDTVYALKEFENYYIICDISYNDCYYVTK